VKPELHEHVNEPTVLVHVERLDAQLCKFNKHSLKLLQTTPFPVKPVLQAHVNDPSISVQTERPT
jgi:hypothetical protein